MYAMIPSQGLEYKRQYGNPHINMLTEQILDVEIIHNFVSFFHIWISYIFSNSSAISTDY